MEQHLIDLARRAVAVVPLERWPGTVPLIGGVVSRAGQIIGLGINGHLLLSDLDPQARQSPAFIPDLNDPAGRGCLLALVREAWGDPGICVVSVPTPDGSLVWHVIDGRGDLLFGAHMDYASEAEALLAALEAAPAKGVERG